jgi:hypothetical protein
VHPCSGGASCKAQKGPSSARHKAEYSHPPPSPLPTCTLDCGHMAEKPHLQSHLHPCKFGRKCKHLTSPGSADKGEHMRGFTHLCSRARPARTWRTPSGTGEHLRAFSHPTVAVTGQGASAEEPHEPEPVPPTGTSRCCLLPAPPYPVVRSF